jgi:maltooligosyltrehalose trehalohydrolase
MDAQWNDDFHHALHVAMTGEHTGYYVDYSGVGDLALALDEGFVLQDTPSAFRRRRHGAPSGQLPPERFVTFAQNHDQIGNRPLGNRLITLIPPEHYWLVSALVILSPNIPLLFMGEEYGERAPFPYFVDHSDPALIEAVRVGRAREFEEIASAGELFDPSDPATFDAARLDHSLVDEPTHRELFDHYRQLISLRRSTPALRHSSRSKARAWAEGNVITLVRSHEDGDVAILFNVGPSKESVSLPTGSAWRDLLERDALPIPLGVTLDPWSYRLFRSTVTG